MVNVEGDSGTASKAAARGLNSADGGLGVHGSARRDTAYAAKARRREALSA